MHSFFPAITKIRIRLDIHNVMHVINYDLPSPQYGGIEEYTHRIGTFSPYN